MTLSFKHAFTNPKGDPADATIVRPSNWNAEHTMTAAANVLLGAVGAGAVSEISCTATARTFLAAASTALMRSALGTIITADITDDAVTYAKIQDIVTTQRLLGRNTAGSGVIEEVTVAQLLNWIASSARGDILVRGASDWARVAKGTAGQVVRSDGTDTAWGYYAQLLHLTETQASGTNSQTTPHTIGQWNKRLLNTTVTNEITSASLASSVISLPAGTYDCDAISGELISGNGYSVQGRLRLRDTTNSTTLAYGVNCATSTVATGGTGETHLFPLRGRFTLAGTCNIELQLWTGINAGSASPAVTTGDLECYTDIQIKRIA